VAGSWVCGPVAFSSSTRLLCGSLGCTSSRGGFRRSSTFPRLSCGTDGCRSRRSGDGRSTGRTSGARSRADSLAILQDELRSSRISRSYPCIVTVARRELRQGYATTSAEQRCASIAIESHDHIVEHGQDDIALLMKPPASTLEATTRPWRARILWRWAGNECMPPRPAWPVGGAPGGPESRTRRGRRGRGGDTVAVSEPVSAVADRAPGLRPRSHPGVSGATVGGNGPRGSGRSVSAGAGSDCRACASSRSASRAALAGTFPRAKQVARSVGQEPPCRPDRRGSHPTSGASVPHPLTREASDDERPSLVLLLRRGTSLLRSGR
jgi:hypothetical protein